jgi:hypothetical protein
MTSKARNTFGILDSTGKLRKDIIGASMQTDILSRASVHQGYCFIGDVRYAILTDQTLEEAFQYDDHILCVVSYQRRTTGNYAVARLHNKSPLYEVLVNGKENV